MPEKLQTYRKESPEDYLYGRVKYPSWLHSKRQVPYVYTASGNSGLAATIIDIQTQKDSCFFVEAISIIDTGTPTNVGLLKDLRHYMTVLIEDLGRNRLWSQDYINIFEAAGFGGAPRYLDTPNLLLPNSVLRFNMTQVKTITLGVSTGIVYISLIGRKVYGLSKEEIAFLSRRMQYTYVMKTPALAAGAAGQETTMQIQNESDFILRSMSSVNYYIQIEGADGGVANNPTGLLMNLRDTSNDKTFFSKKLPVRNFVGARMVTLRTQFYTPRIGLPFRLNVPYLMKRNTTIVGEFDNPSALAFSASQMQIAFDGTRILDV